MEKLDNENIKRLLTKTTVNIDLAAEWDAIQAKMDDGKKKRRFFWWWIGSGFFIATFIMSMLLINVQETNEQTIQQKTHNIEVKKHNQKTQNDIHDPSKTTINKEPVKMDPALLSTIESPVVNTQKPIGYSSDSNREIGNPPPASNTKRPVPRQTIATDLTPMKRTQIAILPAQTEITIKENKTTEYKNEKTIVAEAFLIGRSDKLITVSALPTTNNILPLRQTALPTADSTYYKASNYPRFLIYAEAVLSTPTTVVVQGTNIAYQQRLASDYKILSKTEASAGMGYLLSPRWEVYAGIHYRQYRSVFRGETTSQEITSVPVDTAIIFTNNIGGTVSQSGEVTQTTTTVNNIQQYNYHHALGLQVGTKYSILGPIYAGAQIIWTPINWQKGLMLYADETLQPLTAAPIPKVSTAFEVGYNSQVAEQIRLDIGLRYQPSQCISTIDGTNLRSGAIGARIRLVYVW